MSDNATYDSGFDSDTLTLTPIDPIEHMNELLEKSLRSTLKTTVDAMRPPTISPDCLYEALYAAHKSQIRSVLDRSGFLRRPNLADWEGTCTSTMDRDCTELECVVKYKIEIYTKREPSRAIWLDDVQIGSRATIIFKSDERSKRTCHWNVRIPAHQSPSEVTGRSGIERKRTSA